MIAAVGLEPAFARARAERRAALIAYVVAGDPDPQTTLAVLDALTEAGVDVIELGIPYGDPLADGPTIAAAGQRALEGGMKFADSLAIVEQARARGCAPILFFTYLNPIDRFGAERFARAARDAGAVGAIVPDVPLEELDAFAPPLRAAGLAIPLLIAPTTPPARAERIGRVDGLRVPRLATRCHRRAARARRRVGRRRGRAAAFGDQPAAHRRLRDFDAGAGRRGRRSRRRDHRRQRSHRCLRRIAWRGGRPQAGRYAASLRAALPLRDR